MFFNSTSNRVRTAITAVSSTFTGFLNTLPWNVYHTSPTLRTNGQGGPLESDEYGAILVRETQRPQYENNTTGRAVVEHNYTVGRVTADGQIKASSGFIHSITFAATGTVTAGVITVYANTAESGTIVWSGTIQVALNPTTIILDVEVGAGIYVGYDGTIANVSTSVSYR